MSGKFISVEGVEGAGKSTQMAFIEAYLRDRGINVVLTREPGGTRLGEQIRSLLLTPREEGMSDDAELLLMFAARAEHIAQVIKPALARGDWVLSDRFVDATFAYQGAGRGIDEKRIQKLADWTLAGLEPDLTLLFDLPVAQGMERVQGRQQQKDRFEQEQMAFFERIRDCYIQRAQSSPHRMKTVDASQSINQIQSQLVIILSSLVND